MSLNRESKQAVVQSVVETLKDAQTMVIAQYQGVTVESMTAIRKEARKSDVYLHVLKNTLARISVKGTKFEPLAEQMTGPLVYAVSSDPIAAAKIVAKFAKENDKVKVIAGMFNESLLDEAQVKQLAATPSREELLAMMLGVMQQIPAGFVRAVAAIRDQKEQAA